MVVTDEMIEAACEARYVRWKQLSEQHKVQPIKKMRKILTAALSALPAGVKPLEEYERQEAICTDAAMSQWERSLNRPDMQEKDRVRGAVEAYKRQALAFRMLPPSPQPNVAVTEAAKRYLAAIDSDPENDIWDTWDGEPAEGALKTASDASWADHGQKIEARLSELRAALATTEGKDNG